MNRTEPALGRRRCAGDSDGAPQARCTLAASVQPSAFMKVANGSTWTCMKMGNAQGMLPSTY